ncbi:hypothetical protein [Pseudomonas sp. BMS12]|uniref:hypothetical protein n=1 Tax=Pseudomonas sp. BMS12 TaxID=1796033 RepID=UPI00083B8B4E|nr:hypothetical protein [Pseudomonas sp. BMS12]
MIMSPESNTQLATYPRKVFSGEQASAAYYCVLMISVREFALLCALIAERFCQAVNEPAQVVDVVNGNGEALKLFAREEFSGLLIELTTNSKVFLEQLDTTFKAPPAPWFAFPDMEPIEAIMSKQSSLEYWWNWVWNPFWQHASDEVRMAYLKQHGASDEWIEYLAEPANGSD